MSSYADVTLGSLCLATSRNGFDPTLIWLPGKQQRIWKEFWVQGQVKVSEDYVTAAIDGQPVKANSVYDAIVFEQVEINKLFELMEHWPLFRDTYAEAADAVQLFREAHSRQLQELRPIAGQDALRQLEHCCIWWRR